ncbi:dethiobiotin synthase [Acidiferrobacter sp. SPIII_3]|jgi:dethiobiotin synthetase|uniref:dethiobiotin synthase n=1 Tax=Acidiferrobacter sp. SPIII_3 TaxID=1281578 RepID=UPI000D7326F7|nr:dethiobiotin synthase [Acidiferrobacter sp. SPIII_3]AWP24014.1 dethiobiotin synthase [Acidiferrobacter sp. SPIII_3]
MNGVFVTGTDTGVGKTLVSTALVLGYAERGERVAGLKPIVSGMVEGGVYEDVEALRRASVPARAVEECTLYAFRPAIAPHFAAAQAGRTVDLAAVVRFVQGAWREVDRVVVEGAGGFLVPLTATDGFADLARALNLPVVLVVGLRLGAINHALLTYEAIIARGLVLAGWVGTMLAPEVAAGTLEGLRDYLPAPCLGIVPYHAPVDPEFARRHITIP